MGSFQLARHFRLAQAIPFRPPKIAWIGLAAAGVAVFLFWVGVLPEDRLPLLSLCILAGLFLLRYPEIALVLLIKIGKYKGDDRIESSLPFDPTLAIWALLAVAILLRLVRREQFPQFPRVYLLWLPFTIIMLWSLSYTPDWEWGLEKAGRFILLCGMAIVGPIYILDRPEKLTRFFLVFVASGLLMSLNALTELGSDRLVAPSGLNTQLGAEAAEAILVFVFFILPGLSFTRRLLCYPLILFLLVTLVGAGARGSTLSLALCLPLVLLFHSNLRPDFLILVAVAVPLLAIAPIPEAAITYLASLLEPDPQVVLGFRYDLLSLGWRLFAEHPILGVGIGGYPARSPNAALFNYPHNIVLEVGAEMGVAASLLVVVLVFASFQESLRQILDRMFPWHRMACTAFVLLCTGLVMMLNSGDITSHRNMWLYMALPFALRNLALREKSPAGRSVPPITPPFVPFAEKGTTASSG